MKKLLGAIIMIGCCVIITATDGVQKTETTKVKKTVDMQKNQSQAVSIKKDDVSITGELKQKVYLSGKAIELTVKWTNTSKHDISFVLTNFIGDISWNIIESATKKTVAYTQLGKNAVDPHREIFSRILITISPGKDYSMLFDIAPYFEFQPGGKYELNFGGSFQQDGKKIDYQLKGLTIEIAPTTNTDDESNKGNIK